MSAAKHTPGPWRVNDNPMAMSEYCILAESRGTGFGASVATANQREGYNALSPEEAKANARLIAAAPDLLDAAKKALADCVDLIATPAGEALQTAIAKAEGGAA